MGRPTGKPVRLPLPPGIATSLPLKKPLGIPLADGSSQDGVNGDPS